MMTAENVKKKLSDDDLFKVADYSPERADTISEMGYSYWKSVLYDFSRKKSNFVLIGIFLLFVIMSIIGPEIGKYKLSELEPNMELMFQRPSAEFWFGTDNIGRDYWCQVWYAARLSISLALIVAIGQSILGIIFGLVWGYVEKLDGLFTFLFNIVNNVPTIIYLTLISFTVGQGFWIMAISLILIGWLSMAITVRNMVLSLKDREYNLASRCLGTPTGTILVKNILPQLVSVIILELTLSIPATIAMESTLSFLGLGMDVTTPTLGILLKNARGYFLEYPYLLIFPALIVSVITVTFYVVGNSFADASDPRNHR